MRTQTGTSSLRAILYMDEIFGYFPPSREPGPPVGDLVSVAGALSPGFFPADESRSDHVYGAGFFPKIGAAYSSPRWYFSPPRTEGAFPASS